MVGGYAMNTQFTLKECLDYGGAIVFVNEEPNMIVTWDGTKTFVVFQERPTERTHWYSHSFIRWNEIALFEHWCQSIHHAKQIAKDYCNKEGEYAEEVCFQGGEESQEK